jgi:hypothetical protein
MEEKDPSGAIDNPEIISPFANSPTTDVHGKTGSPSPNSLGSAEKRPSLAQRLAEAFREGVASTKPDYDKRPEIRIPPLTKKNRQESSDAGILDRVIQEGGSSAAAVGDKAASVLDSVVELVKKAPAITHKYVEAFREGAALVKPREGRGRREALPPSAKKNGSPSDGRVILDRVFHAGASAAEIVRGAVAAVKPGEVISGAGRKIRRCKKKIGNLYIEIGREAVNSWGNGPVETEKVAELLDQLRKNEEEIQNLQEHIAEVAAARKTKAAGSQQAAKEAVFTPASDKPASDKEDIRFNAGVSGAKLDEQVYNPGDWQQRESSEGGDFAVEETSVSAAPEAESPASPPAPKHTVTVKKLHRRKK